MSLVTISTKRKRIYSRKFDHDEARRLRVMQGWSYARLARHFGVSRAAVARVVNPDVRRRMQEYTDRWVMGGECRACGGPCARNHRDYCRKCASERSRTRYRYDELGQLASLRCTTCKQWKSPETFPSNRTRPFAKHHECRECGTKARQAYRERHKVPCTFCGAPCLPPKEKATNGAPFPRCRPCFLGQQTEERRAVREKLEK